MSGAWRASKKKTKDSPAEGVIIALGVPVFGSLLHKEEIMKAKLSHPVTIAAVLLFCAPSIGAMLQTILPRDAYAQPHPLVPELLLNEVCFDQTGVDSTARLGSEYVELYARAQVQLDDYTIEDNYGNVAPSLPAVTVPAGSYVLIIFGGGSNAYHPDEDLSDGSGAYMLGLSPSDYLGNAEGGVRLRDGSGSCIDAVYWGTGAAPSGTGVGPWPAGAYFDISMSGAPLGEGDSLGRSANPVADYTGGVADWDRHGGKNAAGPTPKGRNGLERFDHEGLIKWVQAGINRLVTGYSSQAQPGWFTFVGSSVANVSPVVSGNSLIVTADHSFNIEVWGSPTTLGGQVVASYTWDETPGSVSFSRSAVGTLTSPAGFSFSVDYSENASGFHTDSITGVYATEVVYSDGQNDYMFTVDATETCNRIGLDAWRSTEARTCFDYGGAGPKTSSRTTDIQRLGDGVYASTCLINRDYPMGPPPPGTTDSILFQETKVIDTVSAVLNDLAEWDTQITRYDVYMDGSLGTTLRAGAAGTSSMRYHAATGSEPLGSAVYDIHLPLDMWGLTRDIDGGSLVTMDLSGGNLVYSVDNSITVDGWVADSFEYSIDPPHEDEGFLDAVADCATKGGAVGAGAGTMVGGVAGAIGGTGVGTAVGTLGGPPGMVAAATAGGTKGAAAGAFVGGAAGGVAGAGVGAIACGIGNLWDKIF